MAKRRGARLGARFSGMSPKVKKAAPKAFKRLHKAGLVRTPGQIRSVLKSWGVKFN